MPVHVVILPVQSEHRERTPRHVADQRAAARRALAESARLSGAPLEGYESDDDGRPKPNHGWHWSVAHTRHYVVAAVARHAVGVDVEEVCPRAAADFAEIAAEEEWSLLPARDETAFIKIWTAKEAVTKALGVGLAGFDGCALARADADAWVLRSGGTNWTVRHIFHDGHVFAAAGRELDVQWHLPESGGP